MQGSQRGPMLSYAMGDPGASQQYRQLCAVSGEKIDVLMAELGPMLANDAEKTAATDILDRRRG
jgi:hypothetical protein